MPQLVNEFDSDLSWTVVSYSNDNPLPFSFRVVGTLKSYTVMIYMSISTETIITKMRVSTVDEVVFDKRVSAGLMHLVEDDLYLFIRVLIMDPNSYQTPANARTSILVGYAPK